MNLGFHGTLAWLFFCSALLCLDQSSAAPDDLSTIAGVGLPGYTNDGGAATQARISSTANGIATDFEGNIYFADTGNHCIRRINATTGIISTVAGDGSNGFGGDGGLATSAQLNSPSDVAVDEAGNLYIADLFNHRIRMVEKASGNISTIAGSGATGEAMGSFSGDGGAATSATLDTPSSVDVDSEGNVYVSDTFNHRIRKIDNSGDISTVGGSGSTGEGNGGYEGDGTAATSALLNEPAGISVDDSFLYIADRLNNRIRVINRMSGDISTALGDGSNSDSNGLPATISSPFDVAVDSRGNLYFTSPTISNVRRQNVSDATVETIAGTGSAGFNGDNAATESSLASPRGVAVDRGGNLFITDTGNLRIRRVEAASAFNLITTIAGTTQGYSGDGGAATAAQLDDPFGISVDLKGNVAFSDRSNLRIRQVEAGTGLIETIAGDPMASPNTGDGGPAVDAGISGVTDVAFDPAGDLYIADRLDRVVRKVDASTGIIRRFAGDGTTGFSGDGGLALEASINLPSGLFFDSKGFLLIAEDTNHVIRQVNLNTNIVSTIAGDNSAGYSGDDVAATSSSLQAPFSMVRDSEGNLLIADTMNHRIRQVDAVTGVITTIAGTGVAGFTGDEDLAVSAQIDSPMGLAIDADDNLFVADTGNHAIRWIEKTTGFIYTLAGDGSAALKGDGGDSQAARLDSPTSLSFDSEGNLYFTDSGNHRVRRIENVGVPVTLLADGMIGNKLTRLKGNGIYNTAGVGQKAKIKGDSKRPLKFFFAIENDSNMRSLQGADSIQISAKKGNRFLQTKYIQIGKGNVTAAITRGNLVLPHLGPGDSASFKTIIKPKFDRGGKGRSYLINAKSLRDQSKRDVLKAKVKVKIKK